MIAATGNTTTSRSGESPFSRVLGTWVPALRYNGPQDNHLFMDSILWGMAAELAIIAVLWWRLKDKANPFLVAGLFIIAQMLTMGLMSDNAVLEGMVAAIGRTPSAVVVLAGMAIGAATSWLGWQAGKRPTVPAGAAQAA